MDHHCVALNTCVGHHNMNYFIKLLIFQTYFCILSFILCYVTEFDSSCWLTRYDLVQFSDTLNYYSTRAGRNYFLYSHIIYIFMFGGFTIYNLMAIVATDFTSMDLMKAQFVGYDTAFLSYRA
mmetsp:Transcript_76446/g.105824  ORF Transcript_76446/g.105824 Transcript_76446/m.105824 type:complete len:123 (-) Transcript_76446:256-624(-)